MPQTFVKAKRPEAVVPEHLNGVDRHDAIGAPAVRDDFTIGWELAESPLELGNRHRQGPGDVARSILLRWTHVQDDGFPLSHPTDQGLSVQFLDQAAFVQELASEMFDLGRPRLGNLAEGIEELHDDVAG